MEARRYEKVRMKTSREEKSTIRSSTRLSGSRTEHAMQFLPLADIDRQKSIPAHSRLTIAHIDARTKADLGGLRRISVEQISGGAYVATSNTNIHQLVH